MALTPDASTPTPPPPPPPPNQSAAESWCYTQVTVLNSTFKWTIHNFSHSAENMGEALNSSMFSAGSNDKLKWQLRLYPRGSNDVNYLSVFVALVSSNKRDVRANYKFSILNSRKEKTETRESSHPRRFTPGKKKGFKYFVQRAFLLDEGSNLLPEDTLTLYCEISVVEDPINMSPIKFKVPECHILHDFGQLLDGQKFSDVILSVNGSEFAAHKAILAARSPVFSAMFEHEMEEKQQHRVEITDVDHEVLREMLHYIYTGKVSNIEKMHGVLLVAADKYALDRLKIMCEEHICSNLSVGTAAEVLILAHMHGAYQLKAHAVDFINLHDTDVKDTAGWRRMMQTHPNLLAEVVGSQETQRTPPIEPPRKRMKL